MHTITTRAGVDQRRQVRWVLQGLVLIVFAFVFINELNDIQIEAVVLGQARSASVKGVVPDVIGWHGRHTSCAVAAFAVTAQGLWLDTRHHPFKIFLSGAVIVGSGQANTQPQLDFGGSAAERALPMDTPGLNG